MTSPDLDDPGHLHKQFLTGDPTAFARIAETLLRPLAQSLQRRFSALDPHLVETAVDDALLSYFQNPRYSPAATVG